MLLASGLEHKFDAGVETPPRFPFYIYIRDNAAFSLTEQASPLFQILADEHRDLEMRGLLSRYKSKVLQPHVNLELLFIPEL